MINTITRIFKINDKNEVDTTTLESSVKTWTVAFPGIKIRYTEYDHLERIGKHFKSFTSENDAKLFIKSLEAAYKLIGSETLIKLIELYEEENHSI